MALSGTGRESYRHKKYHTIILGCQKADGLESGLAISNNILQFVFMDKKFHFTPIISGYDTINLYFLKYSTVWYSSTLQIHLISYLSSSFHLVRLIYWKCLHNVTLMTSNLPIHVFITLISVMMVLIH